MVASERQASRTGTLVVATASLEEVRRRNLVAETIKMVQALQKGEKPTVNDTKSYNNGVKVVPANLLPPVIVTKENAAEAYANDPTLAPLTK